MSTLCLLHARRDFDLKQNPFLNSRSSDTWVPYKCTISARAWMNDICFIYWPVVKYSQTALEYPVHRRNQWIVYALGIDVQDCLVRTECTFQCHTWHAQLGMRPGSGQYRMKPPHPQQPCCYGHRWVKLKLILKSLHMTVWATEADAERLKILLEFCKQPVAGSETAN